jgi:3-oxoacyl-[acyl-carrier protein] reductase
MAKIVTGQITADLSDQTALVTGASRGIGRAIAVALGRCHATVVCVARDEAKLKETVEAIEAAGGKAEAMACDVASDEKVAQTVDSVVEKYGGLSILINNAGITRDTLFPRMEIQEWDDVINTNLRGTFLFTHAATRAMMRARYGRVVNIASVSGIRGNAGQVNYSASKAGVIGMTRSLAQELAGRNVTVNAVAPGFIETDMTDALGELVIGEVKKRIPARRLGIAEEVAQAVLFLSTPAASYVTGQVLVVDGGLAG